MGVKMLGILTDGVDDRTNIPQMEELKSKGVNSVVPMEIRGGNVDMIGIPPEGFPPIPLNDGIVGSTTLDETPGPNMVGG